MMSPKMKAFARALVELCKEHGAEIQGAFEFSVGQDLECDLLSATSDGVEGPYFVKLDLSEDGIGEEEVICGSGCGLPLHHSDCPVFGVQYVGEPCGSCDDGTLDADGVCTLRCEDEVFDDDHDRDDDDSEIHFADPGGVSALRAETPTNPRNQPCPDCGAENVLTPLDVAQGYCCNRCSDRNEGGGY